MKRVEREIYGFGPRLSTRQDRISKTARVGGFIVGFLVIGWLKWT